mgnify:CR=1 FL=1
MTITEVTRQQLNERFPMSHDMFGWIKPNGELMIPTPDDAISRDDVIHDTMIEPLERRQASEKGYISWWVTDATLHFRSESKISESVVRNIIRAIPKIEVLAQDPKNFSYFKGYHARRRAEENAPLPILKYNVSIRAFDETADNVPDLVDAMEQALSRGY